jgi:hypothetical protein
MPFSENLGVFFQTAHFADVATIGTTSVKGIFEHQYVETLNVPGEAPTFLCQSDELPVGTAREDSIAITGHGTYRIVDMQPDGTGVTLLVLEYVSA